MPVTGRESLMARSSRNWKIRRSCGKRRPACLTRALSEKLAVHAEIGDLLFVIRHAFTHFKITLHAFECHYLEGDPQSKGYAAWQWAHTG